MFPFRQSPSLYESLLPRNYDEVVESRCRPYLDLGGVSAVDETEEVAANPEPLGLQHEGSLAPEHVENPGAQEVTGVPVTGDTICVDVVDPPTAYTITELRAACSAAGLSSKGRKAALLERLATAK